jgi:hypothetical protein
MGWRRRAIEHVLSQLKAEKSAAPFNLGDEAFNRDVLTALAELDQVRDETPFRVFSVRVFNDSKRFELLLRAVLALARRGQPEWKALSDAEVLGELNLVANPGHLYLHGAWTLTDADGQALPVAGFQPSIGFPAAQAARLRRVDLDAGAATRVIAVENPHDVLRADPAPARCRRHLSVGQPLAGLPPPAAPIARRGYPVRLGQPGLWRLQHPGPIARTGDCQRRPIPHGCRHL